MLLRFRVANHRSIRDECELSLIGSEPDGNARATGLSHDGRDVTALPVMGVRSQRIGQEQHDQCAA